ncbi:hypothetical protein [Streptomyces sp. NPDC058045]|uniref:hypothetical protein n=1 Tax=Streptomyces sp. NPDC058045 TaxID=3346311 RepID=UPI0036ED157A
MTSVLARLHDAFVHDEDLDDDLDVILSGPSCLSRPPRARGLRARLRRPARCEAGPDITGRVERLSRMLGQLVNIAAHRASSPELLDMVKRADDVRAEKPRGEFMADRGLLRRMALAALDLVELLSEDEDGALTYGSPPPADGSRT